MFERNKELMIMAILCFASWTLFILANLISNNIIGFIAMVAGIWSVLILFSMIISACVNFFIKKDKYLTFAVVNMFCGLILGFFSFMDAMYNENGIYGGLMLFFVLPVYAVSTMGALILIMLKNKREK